MLANLIVRVAHEWAEFFVHTHEGQREDGTPEYVATWAAVSSYGVFGHHWSCMGEPFHKFIAGVEPDYLLGKIGTMVFDADVCKASIYAAIQDNLDAERITPEIANTATEFVEQACDEYDGDVLCKELYESIELNNAKVEVTECNTQDWESEARGFVDRLWPEFVKLYQLHTAEIENASK